MAALTILSEHAWRPGVLLRLLAVQKAVGGKGFLMQIADDPVTVEEGEAVLHQLDSI